MSFDFRALALGAGLALFGVVASAPAAALPAAARPPPGARRMERLAQPRPLAALAGIIGLRLPSSTATPRIGRSRNGNGLAGDRLRQRRSDLRLDRLYDLRLESRQLRQDLRLARRRHHSAALVLSDRLRYPRRRGTERGNRASNRSCKARSASAFA